jgi:hypothetical protein
MWVDGEPLVHVITGLGVIRAPAVRPDARRPREALSRAQDDPDWLVIEDERKTGHAIHLGKWRAISIQSLSLFTLTGYDKLAICCSTL